MAELVSSIDKGNTAQIDPTNSILFLAGSVFVCMMDIQVESRGINVQSLDMIVGFITKAGTWVRHVVV